MDIHPASNYPLPTEASLRLQYVGKHLNDVLTPAAVIDRAIVRRNCKAMLDACNAIGVNFRAHVKSHKTLDIIKLQVGEEGSADFVVSTLIEAENLLPYLLECKEKGRPCSIIYGVPIPQSAIARLLHLASKLKPRTLHVIIDNLSAYEKFHSQLSATPNSPSIGIYIKIDTGYHRAGIKTTSPKFQSLVETIVQKSGDDFQGFYSHFGHSYAGSSEDDAASGLVEELLGLETALTAIPKTFTQKLTLTVGATPTATAAQNILTGSSPKVTQFRELLQRLGAEHKVELHAGVYPLLDLQQVATHARPATGESRSGFQPLSKENIGLRLLVEVTSVYDERSKPEALVSAGSLAFGREPCKSYPGWGIVTPQLGNADAKVIYDERGAKEGWIMGRVSQEHGILSWEGEIEKMNPLAIGDKVTVWPNHACVAGAGFGWYVVVDSEQDADTVVDVWVRWRGW